MTFFHFVNCGTLAFAPYFLVYKYSGLSEYSTVWRCVQAALAYLLTQLVKLLLIATFFPTSDNEGQQFDALYELLKSSADVVDLVGLAAVMQYVLIGKGEIRAMTAGVGFAAADTLSTRVVPFWIGARAIAFDWAYILLALESSLNLVHYVAVGMVIWLFMRYELSAAARHVCLLLIVYAVARSFVYAMLANWLRGALLLLLSKVTLCACSSGLSLMVYTYSTRPQTF